MGIESIFFFNYAFFLISFLAVVLYLPNSSSVAVTTDKQLHTSSVSMEDQEADNTALLGPDSGRNAHINDINSSSSNSKQKSIISQLYGSLSEFLKKYRQFFKAKSIRVLCLNVFLYGNIMCIPDTFFFVSLEKDYHSSRTFNGKSFDFFITFLYEINICALSLRCKLIHLYMCVCLRECNFIRRALY